MDKMKKAFLKLSSLFVLLPGLTSCNSDSKIILPNSLDVMSGQIEKMHAIDGDFFDSLINTKQNFVLYFKFPICHTCQKIEPYFVKLINENKYDIYSYSTTDPLFSEVYQKYPEYFNVAPKTLFFKQGELKLTLSSNKYNNEQSFLRSMNNFCIKSEMYIARTTNGLDYFLDSFDSFSVYTFDFDNQATYEIFSEIVYPIISTRTTPSLLIDIQDFEKNTFQDFLNSYDLDSSITSWAFNVENNEIKNSVNYLENPDSLKSLYQIFNSI